MNRTSQINLFYLFSSSYNIDSEIKKDTFGNGAITTECAEISQTIADFIKTSDWFHWRIILNDGWFRLIIIGGSWQGDWFARNIENGINMFKVLVERMEAKYPVEDWNNYQIC